MRYKLMLVLLAAACAAPRPAVGQTPELTQPAESRFASFHRAGGGNAAVPAAVSSPVDRPETARNAGGARLALNSAPKAAEPAPHPRGRAGTLGEGLAFMVIGMSVTFIFLIVMIFCMMGLHRLLEVYNRFFPEAPQSATPSPPAEPTNDHVALAIAAAIAHGKERK